MALLYCISSDVDDQRDEAAEFLSGRWSDVLEEDAVTKLSSTLSSASWSGHAFDVEDVEVGDKLQVRFRFEAKGLDKHSRTTGDEISGTAVAVIDEYDAVKFEEIEVG